MKFQIIAMVRIVDTSRVAISHSSKLFCLSNEALQVLYVLLSDLYLFLAVLNECVSVIGFHSCMLIRFFGG